MDQHRLFDNWAKDLALLLAIFAASVWSVHFTPAGSDVAAWWPAAGLSSWYLLRQSGRSRWIALPLIAAVTAAANAVGGRELLVALLFGLANASEIAVVGLMLGVYRGRPHLRNLGDFARVIGAATAGAIEIGLLAGLTVAGLLGGSLVHTWYDVTVSHAASQLVFLPVALASTQARSSRRNLGVMSGAAAAPVLVTVAVFFWTTDIPLAFLPFPMLVAAAFFLTTRELGSVVIAIALLANLATSWGHGPFEDPAGLGPVGAAALVQVYLLVIVTVTTPLSLTVQQLESALAQALGSRDMYRRGIANSPIGMMVLRPEAGGLRIMDANLPALNLVGEEQGVGEIWTVGLAPDQRQRLQSDAADLLAGTSEGSDFEWWLDRPVPTCVRLTLSPVPDTSVGDLVVAQLIDVSSARQAQDMVQRLLSATTDIAIIGTDTTGTITYVNEGAIRQLGWSAKDLIGKRTPASFCVEDELRDRATELGVGVNHESFAGLLRSIGGHDLRDWAYQTRQGRRGVAAVDVSTVLSPRGTIDGYLFVATDVTARQEVADRLADALDHERAAVARLEELDKIKTEFVWSVSHELRTPLTSMLGFFQVLDAETVGTVNDRQREVLERIARNGRRLQDLIEDLLTLSRIEAGVLESASDLVDLHQVMASVAEIAHAVCQGRDLDLEIELPAAGEVELIGDAHHLERAISNLVLNAIKFTADGGSVRATATAEMDEAVIVVSDDGIGISADDQEHIFERFFRATGAADAAIPGTGLGLTIVDSVVENHHGTIDVESATGVGTRFTMRLPLKPSD